MNSPTYSIRFDIIYPDSKDVIRVRIDEETTKEIVRIFLLWCDKKNCQKTLNSFIKFLHEKGLLNSTKVREVLEIFNMEELL